MDPEIFFVGEGEGPRVLALHGVGYDHNVLRNTHRPLKLPARMVYLDFRGSGRSQEPADWAAVGHAEFVRDIEMVRQAEAVERVILLGHSYGCALALEYALAHPRHVAGLILCEGGPAMDHMEHSLELARARSRGGEYEYLLHTLANLPERPEDVETFWNRCLPLYLERHPAEAFLPYFAGTVHRPAAFRHILTHLTPRYDVRSRLREIDAPALVLAGRHDWIHPPRYQAEELLAGLPNAELVIFEESGHFPFFEEADLYRSTIVDWLERSA